ncbi:MAG: DUF1566 domain-containing protein [Ardenticatenales bacterium]
MPEPRVPGCPIVGGAASLRALCALLFALTTAAAAPRFRVAAAATADDAPRAPRLLSTGQAFGYVGDRGVRADGNGDDGDLVRGRAADWSYADVVTPTTQAENLVVDRNTGRMWLRRPRLLDGADGQGVRGTVRFDQPMAWQQALDAARDLVYGGFDDWRLPNINELETVVDFSHQAFALDPIVFGTPREGESTYVWSTTTNPLDAHEAFYLNSFDGHIFPWDKTWTFAVRPVRSTAVGDPVAVFATGQRLSYHGNDGAAGLGGPDDADDGALGLGLARDYAYGDDGVIDSAPENVVLDRATELEWLRNPRLVSGGGAERGNVDLRGAMDWQNAVARCRDLAYAGHDDWRLPNSRELWSIARAGDPAGLFDPAAFPGAPVSTDPERPLVWWSSTTTAGDHPSAPAADRAWFLSTAAPAYRHHEGPEFQPPKSRPGYARCVRDAVPDIVPTDWRPAVRSAADWTALSVAVDRPDVWREGKWLAAASPDAAAPFDIAFQDANRFPLHLEFLRTVFPDRYGGLDITEYTAITAHRATRRLLAGGLRSFSAPDGTPVYGFDVYTADGERDELLTLDETLELYRRLARAFRRRPFVYAPTQPDAIALARTWRHPGLPIGQPSAPPPSDFEAYTRGIAYGTVRRLTVDALAGAVADGQLSWQDIVVLDRAPTDIDVVVAGVVTGARQGPLSHLNVRLGRRGTPNAFVRDAPSAFGAVDGQLIRLEVDAAGYRIVPGVSIAEATAWWAAHRPPPVAVAAPDVEYDGLDGLDAIAAGDVVTDALRSATRRFGGKAANLARLYTFLPDEHEVPGFGIPFHAYAAYVAANRMADPRIPGGPTLSYAEVLTALHADARFNADPAYRAPLLAAVHDAIDKDGDVDPALVTALAGRIDAVFGATTMVRFRSSSNAEDGLAFNGAGLYDSTSVCAADSLDADKDGPSRCDPAQPKERTIERGLRTVFASLWNPRAWSERGYYSIDPDRVAMAILVTPAFPDERANGVAFTGDPSRPELRGEMVVNAQDGDASVVLPESGDLPERDVILFEGGDIGAGAGIGRVTGIRRVQSSSRVPPGTHVLSDDELRRLGGLLLLARANLPVDTAGYDPADVQLDVEWKIRRGDDALLIKQIRPFVAAALTPPPSDLHVLVPEPLQLCTMWRPSSPPLAEYAANRVQDLVAGDATIPLTATAAATSTQTIFGGLADGRDGAPAEPEGPGVIVRTADAGRPGYAQVVLRRRYALGADRYEARLYLADVRTDQPYVVRLDGDALTAGNAVLTLAKLSDDPDQTTEQILGPCGLPVLPRQRYDLRLADGARVTLVLRKGRGFFSYKWATLIGATVDGPAGRAEVRDLRRLVYSAMRHNWSERLMAVFDGPLGGGAGQPGGGDDAIHGIEIAQDGTNPGDGTYTAVYLDAALQPLRTVAVVEVRVTDLAVEGGEYRIALPWGAR